MMNKNFIQIVLTIFILASCTPSTQNIPPTNTSVPSPTPRPLPTNQEPKDTNSHIFKPGNLSFSIGGVAVQVSEVRYTSSQTTLKLNIFTDPAYQLQDKSTTPPQLVPLFEVSLSDQDEQVITPVSGSGGLLDVAGSGAGVSRHRYIFDPIPDDAQELRLTISSISLQNFYTREEMKITLEDREIGDEWSFDQSLNVGPITYSFDKARLKKAIDPLYVYRLEFDYQAEMTDGENEKIDPGCPLLFRPQNKNFKDLSTVDCEKRAGISYFEFGTVKQLGPPETMKVQAAAKEILMNGPWSLSWSMAADQAGSDLLPPVPIDNDGDQSCWNTKKLAWEAAQNPENIEAYYVQVAYEDEQGKFEEAVEFGPLFETQYDFPIDCGKGFRWSVRVEDKEGISSNWSDWVVDDSGIPPG